MRALGLLLGVALVAARADDRTAAPDALSAAKSDLASLKAAAPEAASPASRPVRAEAEGLAPAGPERPAEPTKGTSGNPNWLVDAMLKPSERAPVLVEGADALRQEIDLLRLDAPPAEGKATAAAPSRADAPLRMAVVNPLDSFMDGWISAHDKDLLRPAKADGPALDAIGAGARDLAPRPKIPEALEAANPYLAGLEPVPAPESPAPNPLLEPEPPKPNPFLGPGPKPFDGAKTDLPDFSKPEDDDKYFKQMKRF